VRLLLYNFYLILSLVTTKVNSISIAELIVNFKNKLEFYF